MRKFNFFLHENVKNFTLIPNITLFFIFDDPKKSYVLNYSLYSKSMVNGVKLASNFFFK